MKYALRTSGRVGSGSRCAWPLSLAATTHGGSQAGAALEQTLVESKRTSHRGIHCGSISRRLDQARRWGRGRPRLALE